MGSEMCIRDSKLDRTGADFFRCVEMIKDRLGAKPLVLQVPIGIEASLAGVVDLVKMKAQVWKNEALVQNGNTKIFLMILKK